jgi:hypothetical protein
MLASRHHDTSYFYIGGHGGPLVLVLPCSATHRSLAVPPRIAETTVLNLVVPLLLKGWQRKVTLSIASHRTRVCGHTHPHVVSSYTNP